jgi:hypothetical protein
MNIQTVREVNPFLLEGEGGGCIIVLMNEEVW